MSFSIASSIAGWKTPCPRNVSMTWPYWKNLEKTLSGKGEFNPFSDSKEYSERGTRTD